MPSDDPLLRVRDGRVHKPHSPAPFYAVARTVLTTGIPHSDIVNQLSAVVGRWGANTVFEPGWTPEEMKKAFLASCNESAWQKLTPAQQDNVRKFLQSKDLSSDIFSKSFPSVHHLKGCRPRSGLPKRQTPWLIKQAVKYHLHWFEAILSNLNKRKHDESRLLEVLNRHAKSLQAVNRATELAKIQDEILVEVRSEWGSYDHDRRKACVACFQLLAVVSRLASDKGDKGLLKNTAKFLYPSPSEIRSMCGFPKKSGTFRSFEPVSRDHILNDPSPNEHEEGERRDGDGRGGGSASTQAFKGNVPPNRLETADDVRVALGRISLAYTLEDRVLDDPEFFVDGEEPLDPGWSAFTLLRWTRLDFMDASQASRHKIKWVMLDLLKRSQAKTLPVFTRLPANTGELELRYEYSQRHDVSSSRFTHEVHPPIWDRGNYTRDELNKHQIPVHRQYLFDSTRSPFRGFS